MLSTTRLFQKASKRLRRIIQQMPILHGDTQAQSAPVNGIGLSAWHQSNVANTELGRLEVVSSTAAGSVQKY